jgi:transposase
MKQVHETGAGVAPKKSRGAAGDGDRPSLRLVYLDECEVHAHPRLVQVWRRRGYPLKVPAAGADRKFVVFGALDYATGQLIHQISATKDGEAFAAFLDHLAAQLPEDGLPTIVVLDTVGYHKSHELREHWQRLSSRLRPLWLPAYAPQLNLIERVWRYLGAISALSRRYLGAISALSRRYLGAISALSRRYLGAISRTRWGVIAGGTTWTA